jgi:hypothetical protein
MTIQLGYLIPDTLDMLFRLFLVVHLSRFEEPYTYILDICIVLGTVIRILWILFEVHNFVNERGDGGVGMTELFESSGGLICPLLCI